MKMNRNKGISSPAAVLAILAFVLSPALSQEKAPAPVAHEEPEIVVSSKPMITCEASMTSMMPKGQLPQ